MAFWLTIEIRNGEVPAGSWRRAHGEALTEASGVPEGVEPTPAPQESHVAAV